MRVWIAAALAGLLMTGQANTQEAAAPVAATPPPAILATIERLKTAAAKSDLGYEFTRDLVAEVGPRPAGTEAEARARDWAVARLKALGFSNVRVEPFAMRSWRRTHEAFELTAPFHEPLVAVALGGSAPTPPGGLEGEIVRFADLTALAAAPADSLKGKIAFVDERMARAQDGSGYGPAVAKRRRAPVLAAEKGAIASLIRTVGTSPDRIANTGAASSANAPTAIPAAALSNPDADQLEHLLGKGPVRVRMDIQVETEAEAQSGNVIAEVKGREAPDEIVILAAHLDSWDITPGAQDDAVGVGAMVAAAKLILDLPHHPKRTVRVVLFGSEEPGLLGGLAYAKAHKDELARHIVGAESDFGAGPAWQLRTKFASREFALAFARAVGDLAIPLTEIPARGDSEMEILSRAGVPVFELPPDGYRYFDIHHTVNDTLDKIDPAAVRKNVAAYASLVYLAAESGWDLRAKP
jgi:Zn-dependent M28 family amino/carboxypeptidase